MNKGKRVLYYDILNILAAFGVILLHSNVIAHAFTNTIAWYQAFFIEVVFYWPVPIFFMISGATLMKYRERYTTKEFLKKRFLRTVIPFIIWTLIVATINKINPLEIGIKEFFNLSFTNSIEGIYWFFIPLFSVYMAMPILSLLKDNRKILWYMAGGAFLFTSLLPPLFGYFGLMWNYSLSFITTGGYLIFTILGYLLSTEDLKLKHRIIIYIFGIFGALIRYGATVYLNLRDGMTNRTFFNYLDYYSVFLAVAVFVFFKYSKTIKKIENNKKLVKIIQTVSGCSFGIYLMHMIINRTLALVIPTNCWEWRLLVPFLIYFIGLTITYIMKKIPIIKYIVP